MAEPGIQTRTIYSGLGTDTSHKVMVPPIHLSMNYVSATPGESDGYDYSRTGNPTCDLLSNALATLEGDAAATVVATGLAAVTLLVKELIPVGSAVVCQHDYYGRARQLLNHHATRGRLKVRFVDFNDPEVSRASLDGVSMVLAETPSNLLLRITDLRVVAEATRAAGAQLVMDNIFRSSLLQCPIDLGANYVLHSATKFTNGHSDVVGGTVVTRDPETVEHVGWLTNALGLIAGVFSSYPMLRGLWTLDAHIQVHVISTETIVNAAQGHPAIATLHWPGLETHPGYELVVRRQPGFGSLLSTDLAGGRPTAERFLQGLQVFHLAESPGEMEPLVYHPVAMAHTGMSPEARAVAGISDDLLRLSVGLEAAEDLVAATTEVLDGAQGRGESID